MRDSVKSKLYKTAFTLFVVFGIIGFLVTVVMAGHDVLIGYEGRQCLKKHHKDDWIELKDFPECNVTYSELSKEFYVRGSWIDSSIGVYDSWPVWLFFLSPLWLLPALLLVLFKKWVGWVLK